MPDKFHPVLVSKAGDRESAVENLIRSGDLEGFRLALKTMPNLLNEQLGACGWALLHFLSSLGLETKAVHATMAEDILKAGADVNCRTVLGWTPIHMIAMQGQKEACQLAQLLIAHGADLTALDNSGMDWRMHWQHGTEIRRVLETASIR